MITRQHTEGEWRHATEGGGVRYIMSGDTYLATVHGTEDGIDNEARAHEGYQNGELMAAAPEMLRTLQAIDDEAKDGNSDQEVVIPSYIFDLVLQQLRSVGMKEAA